MSERQFVDRFPENSWESLEKVRTFLENCRKFLGKMVKFEFCVKFSWNTATCVCVCKFVESPGKSQDISGNLYEKRSNSKLCTIFHTSTFVRRSSVRRGAQSPWTTSSHSPRGDDPHVEHHVSRQTGDHLHPHRRRRYRSDDRRSLLRYLVLSPSWKRSHLHQLAPQLAGFVPLRAYFSHRRVALGVRRALRFVVVVPTHAHTQLPSAEES